jgi:formylglycine-generating enzyme
MKRLLMIYATFLLLVIPGWKLDAQSETKTIFLHRSEKEVKDFLEGKGYILSSFNPGIPKKFIGAKVYTKFFLQGSNFESYEPRLSITIGDSAITFEGSRGEFLNTEVLYFADVKRTTEVPITLLFTKKGWVFEMEFSPDNTGELFFFRVYTPSFIDNTLNDVAWFTVSSVDLVIHKPEIEWVDIPLGKFIMGASKKEMKNFNSYGEEQHEVTLSAFKMSKYEITFDEYALYCQAMNKPLPNDKGWGQGKQPVINVSYQDAKAFAEWLGCRLPTEAEWEYACRAGTTTAFNTGECLDNPMANFYCYSSETKYIESTKCCTPTFPKERKPFPVGSFPPNAWGLYDMHGNVYEWTSDSHYFYSDKPQVNPRAVFDDQTIIIRGGSYDCFLSKIRSAARNRVLIKDTYTYGNPPKVYESVGIRLVKD